MFPTELDIFLCNRSQIVKFTEELKEIGVEYMGLCCGNRAHYIRAMAETLGRSPLASKYSANMEAHFTRQGRVNKEQEGSSNNFNDYLNE